MKSISRSSLLIIVFFTFTSCMPPLESSRVLYERGVVYESISQPFTVIKSKDGDIASKCLANYSYKDINFRFSFGGGSYTNFLNRDFFVILDKEKLIKDVLSQANSTAIFGEKKRIQIDIAWYVKERIPEEFDSDISELLLPEKFQNDAEVTIWEKEESLWSRTVPFKLDELAKTLKL